MSVLHVFHVHQTGLYHLSVNLYLNFRLFLYINHKVSFHLHDDKALCCVQKSYTQRQKYSKAKKMYTSSPISRDSSAFY